MQGHDLVGSAEGRRELAPKVVAVPVHLISVWGFVFSVGGLGFRDKVLDSRVEGGGAGLTVDGSRAGVWDCGRRVQVGGVVRVEGGGFGIIFQIDSLGRSVRSGGLEVESSGI